MFEMEEVSSAPLGFLLVPTSW